MTDVPGSATATTPPSQLPVGVELRAIVDNIPVAVVHIDRRETVDYANSCYCKLFHSESEAIIGKTLIQVVGERDYVNIKENIRRGLAGENLNYTREVIQSDGDVLNLEVSLVPDRSEQGRVKGLYCLLRDITEQTRAEMALRDSEQRHSLAAHGAADGLWDWHPVTKALYLSPRLLAILGYPPDFRIHHTDAWQTLLHPDDRGPYNRLVARHLKGETPHFEFEFRVRTADGQYRWVHSRGLASWDENRVAIRMAGSISDISERKRAETELRHTTERLNLAMRGSKLVLWDVNLASGQVYLSEEWTRIYGSGERETVISLQELTSRGHPEDIQRLREHFIASLKGVDAEFDLEHRIRSYQGRWIWIHSRGKVVERDSSGRALRFTGTSADIDARKAAEQRIQYLATRDALTDLPNRVLLGDRLQLALSNARREGHHLGVCFLDLDHFKHVNDSLGHHAGDLLLKAVARRLRACLRSGDTVARQGGDEFIILLTEVTAPEQLALVAEKLLTALTEPLHVDGHELVTTASIGIAVFPEDGRDMGELLRNADTAMYHAKSAGRANYQFFEERMNQAARQRLALESALRQGLSGGEFCLHYQPQVSLDGGAISGAESLIRWMHPRQGLMLPGTFIPVAEESGLVIGIGEWVLREACQEAHRWRELSHTPLRLAVNVSMRQFRRKGFADTVVRTLEEADLPCDCLELEITESLLLESGAETLENMHTLADRGVELAVDDFGTGYASMTYLKRLPVQRVKIDRSFVEDIPGDSGDVAIVRAIVTLAHNLGMQVVAEGVETAAQQAFLQDLGCDFAQGYYFSRPLPTEGFQSLLRGGMTLPGWFAQGPSG